MKEEAKIIDSIKINTLQAMKALTEEALRSINYFASIRDDDSLGMSERKAAAEIILDRLMPKRKETQTVGLDIPNLEELNRFLTNIKDES